MRNEHTVKEVHGMLTEYFRCRPDVGFWKSGLDLVLEPPNPFEPTMRRRSRRDFILVTVLVGMPVGAFIYFNF